MNEGRQYKAIYQGAHIFVVLEKFIQVLDKQHNDVARKSISQGRILKFFNNGCNLLEPTITSVNSTLC